MILNCNVFSFLVFNDLKQLLHLLLQEDNTNPKKIRDENDDLDTFKSSKNVAKKLIWRKRKNKEKLWWRMYFNKYNFHLAFWIAASTVLRILLLYDSRWQNSVTLYLKKLAASKTNKYKKTITNATLEMVRSSHPNALVTQLHFDWQKNCYYMIANNKKV